MKRTIFISIALFFAFSIFFNSTALAASWYKVKVVNTVARVDGSVEIQFFPGETETRFELKSRAIVQSDTSGANKILAIILTSVALKSEILIGLDYVPSWTIQDVVGTGMLSP